MRLARAIDLWLGELSRAGRQDGTLDLSAASEQFVDQLERTRPDVGVQEVTTNDCRAFLDGWRGCAASTVCTVHSAVNGLFAWLFLEGEVEVNPMARIKRPRRPRPGEADVVIVTPDDVGRMFAACDSWQEFLCLSVLAYVGARRDAASRLRWRDVDLSFGSVRLHEKGGKVVDVTIPDELAQILREACESGAVRCGPDDCVIPNRRPASVKRPERSNKSIWETEIKIARGAGVRSTVHALRRAFAVAFLTSNPGAIEALKELLNHSRIDTTQVYLKALNRSHVMEPVRDLSWAAPFRFPSQASEEACTQEKAHTGFEPVPPP